MRGPRLKRDISEMVDRLVSQLAVLDRVATIAFGNESRTEFLPEVATKLRLLTVPSKQNKPLLLEVAKALSLPLVVTLGGPPIPIQLNNKTFMPGDAITLDQFLDLGAVTMRTSAGLITFTKRELIRAWSEQLGGAHEDWTVDEGLVNAVTTEVRVLGMNPTVMELRNTTHLVISKGNELVAAARMTLLDANRSST